jgi:hypothetical protein
MTETQFLSDVFSYWLFGAVAFVFLFVAALLLVAKHDAGRAVAGCLRLAFSFLSAPVFYLRAVVASLVEYAHEGDAHYKRSKQYLLQKVMLLANTGLLVGALSLVAAGLVASWLALYPPEQRVQRRVLAGQIEAVNAELKDTRNQLEKLNAESDPKAANLKLQPLREAADNGAAEYDKQRKALQANDALARLYVPIERYLESQEGQPTSVDRIQAVTNEVVTFLNQNGADETAKQAMRSLVQSWVGWQQARAKLTSFEEQMRTVDSRRAALEQAIQAEKSQIERLESERQALGIMLTASNLIAAILAFARMLIAAFFFVWFGGLLVESAGLLLDMADNLRLMRLAAGQHQTNADMASV